MSNPTTDPVILSWPEMQKKAEREGVDVMDYVTCMYAHILNQRDELARKNKEIERLQGLIHRVVEWEPALPAEASLLDELAAAVGGRR